MNAAGETGESWDTLNACSDERLAALFLAGQHDALAVLFDRYSRLAYSIAVRIVKDPGEAEDIVQTVFLDFSKSLGSFDVQLGTLKVWLLQFAYHRALHRKRHLMAKRFYHWVGLEDVHPESNAPLASEVLERGQLLEKLLERTSSQRRAILELTYCEGFTANEVAIRLGLSANVVRHELYRALAELRKLSAGTKAVELMPSSRVFFSGAETNAQSI
jgi:RNA polymerase sigma-70 factor (ECF subfamily)